MRLEAELKSPKDPKRAQETRNDRWGLGLAVTCRVVSYAMPLPLTSVIAASAFSNASVEKK